jgi:hypothetical protein
VIPAKLTTPTKGITTAVRLLVFTELASVTATTMVTGMKGRQILLASQTTSTTRDTSLENRSSKNLQLSAMISVATLIARTPFLHRKIVNQN